LAHFIKRGRNKVRPVRIDSRIFTSNWRQYDNCAQSDHNHYILTEYCLRKAGIQNEIIWFEDGQATLDFLNGDGHPREHSNKYIMLLDIKMPKVNGIDILKELKTNEHLMDISTIMLTTSDDHHLVAECYELGCQAHIVKPPGKVLIKAIERVAQRI